jgi:hypothetical protein
MGQFKPMVKMMTDEPSVILKLKKGGKVAKKADGGFMPMATPQPAPMGMPARGGDMQGAAPMRPGMMDRIRAMRAARPPRSPAAIGAMGGMNPNMMKKGGKAMAKHEDAAQDRAMIKKALAGKKFATGGKIDAVMDKTTIKGNAGKFLNTKVMDGDKNDGAKGTKGVKSGNAGGYANGGTISGNAGKFLNTKVMDGDKNDSAKSTGKGVKMGNNGGYAKGGTIGGSNWENRPADTAKPGKSGGATGGVRNGNAGGYKKGGAAKKAYATGGNVVDDGRAVAMPKKHVSCPVANSLQSGTFKKGGNVGRYRDGDSVESDSTPSNSSNMRSLARGGKAKKYEAGGSTNPNDKLIVKDPKAVADKASRELEDALNPLSFIQEMYGKAKDYLKPAPNSVTKIEKSTTVTPPAKKRGGSC